jgi:hypothetical protein
MERSGSVSLLFSSQPWNDLLGVGDATSTTIREDIIDATQGDDRHLGGIRFTIAYLLERKSIYASEDITKLLSFKS